MTLRRALVATGHVHSAHFECQGASRILNRLQSALGCLEIEIESPYIRESDLDVSN